MYMLQCFVNQANITRATIRKKKRKKEKSHYIFNGGMKYNENDSRAFSLIWFWRQPNFNFDYHHVKRCPECFYTITRIIKTKLVINSDIVRFLIEFILGLGGVNTPCQTNGFCLNGGTCVSNSVTGLSCTCPQGFTGRFCEQSKYYKFESWT